MWTDENKFFFCLLGEALVCLISTKHRLSSQVHSEDGLTRWSGYYDIDLFFICRCWFYLSDIWYNGQQFVRRFIKKFNITIYLWNVKGYSCIIYEYVATVSQNRFLMKNKINFDFIGFSDYVSNFNFHSLPVFIG